MAEGHDPKDAIGRVTHYLGHLGVAAVAIKVDDHVREHDLIFRER
jgi:hypothetical protein